MKTVYNVIVVTKKGQILLDTKVVAATRDEALLAADVGGVLKASGVSFDKVSILAVDLGKVAVEPEPQAVRIVQDSEKQG